MAPCPHCRETGGINAWAKRFSSRGSPVACSLCGGLSHVLSSQAGGTFILTAFLLVAAILAGALTDSWLAGLSICLLAVAYNLRAWQREALSPILRENVQAAARANWAVAALYFVIALFS